MVKTIIVPKNQDLSIRIPENYVGRQIEVLVYAVDELNLSGIEQNKKPSDFRGGLNLSEDEYADFQQHLRNIRNEWDANI